MKNIKIKVEKETEDVYFGKQDVDGIELKVIDLYLLSIEVFPDIDSYFWDQYLGIKI